MAEYLMGIDNGGTVAKAALFSLDGKEIALASSKTEILSPKPGWAEFDANKLWKATAASAKRVIVESGIDSREIVCVACTGHGNGIYLVDLYQAKYARYKKLLEVMEPAWKDLTWPAK